MACNKFEESGLLYVSGELDEHEIRQFEAHLEVCGECRRETEEYKKERSAFYRAEYFEEVPSQAADSKIIRICSVPKKRYTSVFMPLFMQKKYVAAPLYILMIMVAIGGYVQYHSMNANNMSAQILNAGEGVAEAAASEALASASSQVIEQDVLALSEMDSAALFDSAAAFSKTRGNLNMEGVVTVKGSE